MAKVQMDKVIDWGERLFLLALASFFLKAIQPRALEHPYIFMLAISECLPVALILFRRPGSMTKEPLPFVYAFLGTASPLLVRPASGGFTLIPEAIIAGLMTLGVGVNIVAKLALWRSFGLAPANRGIRNGGPYRFIRHPMYLGYFLTQVGFLLGNFTVGNLLKYGVTWTVQLLRIREEEKFLMTDESYRELASRVRYRVVPGLY